MTDPFVEIKDNWDGVVPVDESDIAVDVLWLIAEVERLRALLAETADFLEAPKRMPQWEIEREAAIEAVIDERDELRTENARLRNSSLSATNLSLCLVLAELVEVATGYEPSEDRYQAAVKAASLALRKYWQTGGAEAETELPYYGDNFEENVRARLRREGWLDHEPTEEEWRAAPHMEIRAAINRYWATQTAGQGSLPGTDFGDSGMSEPGGVSDGPQ